MKEKIKEKLKWRQASTQVIISIPNETYDFLKTTALAEYRNVRQQCVYYMLKGIQAEKREK